MALGRLNSVKTVVTGINTNIELYTSTGTLSKVTINVTNQGTEDAVFSIGISSGTAFRDSDVIIYGQTIEKNTYASITNVGICSGETIFVRANKANISFIANSVVDYDASIGTFFGRQNSVRTSLSGPVFVNTPVVLYTAPKAAQVSISVNNTSLHNSRYSIGISSGGLSEFTSADYIVFGQSLPKRTTQIIDSIGIGTGQSIIVKANESDITFAAYDLPTSVLEKIIVTDAISIGSSVTAFGGFYGNLVGIATFATSAGIATNVSGGIASVTSLSVSGISTLGIASVTSLSVSGISTLGIASVTSLSVSGISTLGIASVTSLSVSGISTLGITSATNLTAQQLNVSGVGTIVTFNNTTANITTGNIVTGVVTTISGTNLNYTGVSTLGITSATNLTSQTLNVSGLSTFAGVTTHTASLFGTTASFIGVVTATTGNFTNVSISNAITTVAGKPILNNSGSIIQTVYVRSDDRTSYASNPSGDGTTISPLGLTITPTNANNRIICQWMINGEMHQDNVILIHRDGALITTAGEEGRNSVSNNRWSGYASAFYDQNEDTTPSNWVIMYSQIAGSTASRTYAPAVRSSSSGTYTFYLNRTVGGSDAGQDAYERMVSTGVLYEVVV